MQPTGHPRAREDLLFRQVDDDWVLYDPAVNELHVLNLSAALVWSHCTGEHAPAEIAAALRSTYGLEPARAEADVDAALARFRKAGLLVD